MNARILLKPRSKNSPTLHPWVFAGAIGQIEGTPADGDAVAVHSPSDKFIAHGLYNSRSKIAVRLYSREREVPLEAPFWEASIRKAIRFREQLGLLAEGGATRLVFSEGDRLSGMVVDKFDRWLVLQFTSLAMAARRELFADILERELQPHGIYLRTEKGIGKLEGLTLADCLLRGREGRDVAIREGAVRFAIDLEEGQKTGFYIDQRENHLRVAELMAGREVLDLFCYTGGFGLHCARGGAKAVLAVDASAAALELGRRNAAANELENVRFEKSDAFEFLARAAAEGKAYTGIILDPPKFARSQKNIPEALAAYRRLLRGALKLAADDCILVMCCCSGLIVPAALDEVIAQAAADARRFVQIVERRGQAVDHPVDAACPESAYLKCVVCRVV